MSSGKADDSGVGRTPEEAESSTRRSNLREERALATATASSPNVGGLHRKSAHQKCVCVTQLEHREHDDSHRNRQACWRTLHRRS